MKWAPLLKYGVGLWLIHCLVLVVVCIMVSAAIRRVVWRWRRAFEWVKWAGIASGICLIHSIVVFSTVLAWLSTPFWRAVSRWMKGARGSVGLWLITHLVSTTLRRAIAVHRRPVVGVGDAFRRRLFPVCCLFIGDWEIVLSIVRQI